MRRTALAVGVVAGLALGTSHAEAAPAVVDLGTLGGAHSAAVDVNDSGVAVGWAETADGQRHAVKWDRNGRITDLGTLGGVRGEAVDINERGEIAGTIVTEDGWGWRRAVRWNAQGVGVELGGGGRESWSVGIDDFGFVSGTREAPNGDGYFRSRAFRWERSGRIVDYGPLNGGEAYAASSRGIIAGSAWHDDGRRFSAARWDIRGTLTRLESYGDFGSLVPTPTQVNNAGVVIGTVNFDYGSHAVRWDEQGRITDLGTLSAEGFSTAVALNEDGMTVGFASIGIAMGPYHAVCWDQHGQITDLGTLPGGRYSAAADINRDGTIVGSSDTAAVAWDAQGRITELPGLGDGTSAQAVAVNDRGLAVGYSYTNANNHGHALLWHLPG